MDIVPIKKLDHVEQFLRSFTSENTRIAYEKDLKDYAMFSSTMDPLSFSALVQYRDSLIASSAPATVVRKISAVKSFLGFLASEGLLKHNPAMNLRIPKARTLHNTEAFEDSEVVRILRIADVGTFSGNAHRMMLLILFNLGLRRSELVNLRVSSVQEHRGTRFLSVVGKGCKQRLIPLTEAMVSEVRSYLSRYESFTGEDLQPNDFLIQSTPESRNERPFSPSSVCRVLKQYAKAAGITKRVSPHSCRATMISHLLEKQVSPRCVADLAGHASIQTTVDIYDRKRDALSNPAASKVSYEPKEAS